MMFKLEEDMTLFYLKNKTWWKVDMVPCFPLSNPDDFFSVRDDKGCELELIEKIDQLGKEDCEIIQNYLSFKSFVFDVIGIYEIHEDFGVRNFIVKTKQGKRTFQTALEDWPQKGKECIYSVESLHGEKYRFQNLEFGQKLLDPYI